MWQNGYIPTYGMSNMAPTLMGFGRGPGLFASLRGLRGGTSLFRGINFGSLLNNASRTLGVVNQAVPLVKQVGPMFNNMKSMLKLASAFKDETDDTSIRKQDSNSNNNNSNNDNYNKVIPKTTDNLDYNYNYAYVNQPNFFI